MAHRTRHPDQSVTGQRLSVSKHHFIRPSGNDFALTNDCDLSPLGIAIHPLDHRPGVPGQDFRSVGHQRQIDVRTCFLRQAGLQGEGKFHAPGAAPDHYHAEGASGCVPPCANDEFIHLPHESGDGTGGKGVFTNARQVETDHGRADVEGGEVVRDGGMPLQLDLLFFGVDAQRLGDNDLGMGQLGQGSGVDLQLFSAILSRHEARHHARIYRNRRIHDHREMTIGRRDLPEGLEYLNMSVATADEDQLSWLVVRHACNRSWLHYHWER